jgi:L-lactate dehydrogenase complex protein LldG
MEESTTKEKILKKIRDAIIYKIDNPFPKADYEKSIYNEPDENPDIAFATAFTKAGGKFVYCPDEKSAMINIKTLVNEKKLTNIFTFDPEIQSFLTIANIDFIKDARYLQSVNVGITYCEFLISRFGSIVISSLMKSGRRLPVFSDIHIVLAFSSQIVPGIKEALAGIKNRYGQNIPSMISIITGPSCTSEIENTFVTGVHGPREQYVFLIDDIKTI